jgi:phospholipid transport system transporter-binding protein
MIEASQGRWRVTGPVTLRNAVALRAEGLRLLQAGDAVVDLSGVTEADSAALSLLLEWCRAAAAAGRSIRFEHPTGNLDSLATLYNVRELLPGF